MFGPLLQAAAQGGVSGTLAGTLGAITGSMTAAVGIVAVAAGTLAPLTGDFHANVGTDSSEAVLAGTLLPLTGSATATVSVSAALAGTLQPLTGSMVSMVGETAILAGTLLPLTGSVGATVWNVETMPAGVAFDFDTITMTVQADGSVVSSWTDSVGGAVAAQATSGKQPKYQLVSKGGKPSIRGEGGQALIFSNSALKIIIDSGNFTVVLAVSDVLATSIGTVFGSSSGGTAFAMMANGSYAGRYDGNVTGHTLPTPNPSDFAVIVATSETLTAGNYGGMGIPFEREYLNGTCYKSENSVVPATSAALFAFFDNNGGFLATSKLNLYKATIYPRALTPKEVLQATVTVLQRFNQPLPWGGVQRFDLHDGDSIRDNVGVTPGTGAAYLTELARGRKPGQWSNFAIGAIRTQQSTAKLGEVADYMAYLRLPSNYSFFEYINGQNANRTTVQLVQDMVAHVAAVRRQIPNARVDIEDSTAYGRDLTDRLYASYRGPYNSQLATAMAGLVDHYTAISADPDIGDPSANNRVPPTVGADAVHLNALGHDPYLKNQLIGVYAALDASTSVFGAMAGTLQPITGSVVAESTDVGTLAGTLGAITGSMTALVAAADERIATLAGTLLPLMGDVHAVSSLDAVLAGALQALTGSMTAVVADELDDITGTLAGVLRPLTGSITAHVATPTGDLLTLSEIVPLILNHLVDGRVWQNATPDDLPRSGAGNILPFIVWTKVGGQDEEYIDQTMGTHRHARIQVHSLARGNIAGELLTEATMQALLAAPYTVGVLGSPVGTYDAPRKLTGGRQQFSIWFRRS